MQILFVGADNEIVYGPATAADSGALITGGSGTWSLADEGGTPVAGGSGGLTNQGGGVYTGLVPAAVTALLNPGGGYLLTVNFAGSGLTDKRRLNCTAAWRMEQ